MGMKLSFGQIRNLIQIARDNPNLNAVEIIDRFEPFVFAPLLSPPNFKAASARTYVLLYFPKISLGSPPLRLVGPFKDLDDASNFGRAWQDNQGDNPCWQTIEFERDEIAHVVICIKPSVAIAALDAARGKP